MSEDESFDETVVIQQTVRVMRVFFLLGVVLVGALTMVQGQTNRAPAFNMGTNKPITLPNAIQMALEHNLSVAIERFNPRLAGFTLSGSYGAYDPVLSLSAGHAFNTSPGGVDAQGRSYAPRESERDSFGVGLNGAIPTGTGLSYDIFANTSGSDFTSYNVRGVDAGGTPIIIPRFVASDYVASEGISLTQPLLKDFLIDNARLQIQINKRDLRISEWRLRQQIMMTIAGVEQAYYRLIFSRENIKVQETAYELAQQLVRESKKRVQVGAIAPLDEKQAESQAAATEATLIEAQRNYSQQENALKALVTDDFASLLGQNLNPIENLVAVPVVTSLSDSWSRGLTSRPEIQERKLTLEKQDFTLKYQKNQIWPSLDVTASYGQNANNLSYSDVLQDLGRDKGPNYGLVGRLSFPIGNTAAKTRYQSSKINKQQLLLQYKQQEQSIMVEIDDAIKTIRSTFEQVQSSRAARAYAQDALFAEQKKLENGRSTSYMVLQSQRDLTQRQFDEIQALAQYNIALSDLAFREGTILERHNLSISFDNK